MKRKQIALVLAILFAVSGCSVSVANREESAPSVSSAGKLTVESTKKIVSAAKKQAEKEADIASKGTESMDEQDADTKEKEPVQEATSQEQRSGSNGNANPASVQKPVAQTTPAPEPDPEPVPVSQPTTEPEPVKDPIPTPEPKPATPPQACPGGKNPDLGCEVILDTNYYRETFGSYNEAMARGQYYMDEVMYIGDIEITSYSVQEVYRNDHSIAYYGLNLWSNGSLIQ